ncbi:glycosyltransferase family 39 protein [Desertifilum sp. FACHB-1129]|uniref:Uncharacterized protein n=1 Tax=Desertifilum tharense IPPAS B-1220 TaxID=1781255 RepID=A0A1E5QKG6_9CYAN|nr:MULTISPECIES: glycosyltransferase family 39 protein [Desertifilum]MDA0211787.1 glycosyltransferase family 39 protein [Cyanobacteria bacterium FC1]MBD2312016.1 glycosyltransferase family 39 protein [Desertifilum sp. FACHB-1129]MBD2322469.1 glycosyltransferase family 39 protein [Desertifilum sp. FACHB-866]MBD2332632.1 glycosyltransferase family 39 protein [Desertifilum sp. FACHB-868]OEJ75084.1 hypothetical protein BH720_11500 [Desertifilum tharense IPPAS B-1220]
MKASFRHFVPDQVLSAFTELLSVQRLPWTIISLGILARSVQYFSNRSLWADEAVLALNIVNRSYGELFQPLDYEQGAPIGFLLIEKLATQLLGENEYALRLLPFVSSIVALVLVLRFAKQWLVPAAVPIAAALMAGLPHLIYFSTEVKQYSSDVAIALLALGLALRSHQRSCSLKNAFLYGILGAIFIWCAHPAIFVLGGVSLSCLYLNFRQRKPVISSQLFLIYSLWLLSFLAFYWFSLNDLSSQEVLIESWRNKRGFPEEYFDIGWVFETFLLFFHKPLGFEEPLVGFGLFTFILGCVAGFSRHKSILLILASPFLVTLLAASLEKYPFANRLILFLTPFAILIMAEGAGQLWQSLQRNARQKIGTVFLIALLGIPVGNIVYYSLIPTHREEIRPVLQYITKYHQPSDVLYVYQRGIYQFLFYAHRFGFEPGEYILGVEDLDHYQGENVALKTWERYKADLDNLQGNERVWVLFSHVGADSRERKTITSYLDIIGTQLDAYKQEGAAVFLYNLSQKSSAPVLP